VSRQWWHHFSQMQWICYLSILRSPKPVFQKTTPPQCKIDKYSLIQRVPDKFCESMLQDSQVKNHCRCCSRYVIEQFTVRKHKINISPTALSIKDHPCELVHRNIILACVRCRPRPVGLCIFPVWSVLDYWTAQVCLGCINTVNGNLCDMGDFPCTGSWNLDEICVQVLEKNFCVFAHVSSCLPCNSAIKVPKGLIWRTW